MGTPLEWGMFKIHRLAFVLLFGASCSAPQSLADFQRLATSQDLIFGMPRFERTSLEIQDGVDFEIVMAEMMLQGIADQNKKKVSFESGGK